MGHWGDTRSLGYSSYERVWVTNVSSLAGAPTAHQQLEVQAWVDVGATCGSSYRIMQLPY